MKIKIAEECSVCMKELLFASEEERSKAMNEDIGEIVCSSCKAEVGAGD
ncbi:MAG: hypothetical protein SCK29_00765 [Bacillota bacterium]|nr:hypothetical protein [Bacillota bacterium]MDW7682633.1 hypothetical protein [Bacillota bacterium]